MTELQLQIQEWADKTLSFGAIIETKRPKIGFYLGHNSRESAWDWQEGDETVYTTNLEPKSQKFYRYNSTGIKKVIGHPMTYGRLLYLAHHHNIHEEIEDAYDMLYHIKKYAEQHIEIFNGNVLTRPKEFLQIVYNYLSYLPKDENNEQNNN